VREVQRVAVAEDEPAKADVKKENEGKTFDRGARSSRKRHEQAPRIRDGAAERGDKSALQRHTIAPDRNERANEDQTKGCNRGAERADEKNYDFDRLLPNEYKNGEGHGRLYRVKFHE
jgi:hypothetical protein